MRLGGRGPIHQKRRFSKDHKEKLVFFVLFVVLRVFVVAFKALYRAAAA
jgi:hypothetical protein